MLTTTMQSLLLMQSNTLVENTGRPDSEMLDMYLVPRSLSNKHPTDRLRLDSMTSSAISVNGAMEKFSLEQLVLGSFSTLHLCPAFLTLADLLSMAWV